MGIERRNRKSYGYERYHRLHRRKGTYHFLFGNLLKLILSLVVFIGILLLIKFLLPDVEKIFHNYLQKFPPFYIFLIFFVSETLLGLLPPDLFILWTSQFAKSYLMVGLLAVLSYAGGLMAYFIGLKISHIRRIEDQIQKRFFNHIGQIRKWGTLIIIIAALFPLPFSPICLAAGLIRYNFSIFAKVTLFRIVRFFAYALILFQIV
jgi:membrane protein YqaA with SNARE-associated domain